MGYTDSIWVLRMQISYRTAQGDGVTVFYSQSLDLKQHLRFFALPHRRVCHCRRLPDDGLRSQFERESRQQHRDDDLCTASSVQLIDPIRRGARTHLEFCELETAVKDQ